MSLVETVITQRPEPVEPKLLKKVEPKLDTDIYIDASSMKKMYCRRAYQLACMQGYIPREMSGPLAVGKALHIFSHLKSTGYSADVSMKTAMQFFYENVVQLDASEATKLVEAMANFMEVSFGKPLTPEEPELSVELFFKFKVDWASNEKRNVYLVGTIDRLAHDEQNDLLVAYDWKTSRGGFNKEAKEKVVEGYSRSIQFIFYYWIIKTFYDQILPDPKWFKYVQENKFAVCPVPVFIKNNPVRWYRGDYLRFDNIIPEFETELKGIIQTVCDMHEEGLGTDLAPLTDPSGMISDSCPRCDFRYVCFRSQGMSPKAILDALYLKRSYDPSQF